MSVKKIQKTGYMSDIDVFLRDYDKKNPKMVESRIKEIEKHQKIFEKRDNEIDQKDDFISEHFG